MKPGIYYSTRLDQLLICWEVYNMTASAVFTYGDVHCYSRCGIAVESGWRPTLLISDEEFDELMCEWVEEL